MKNLIIGFEAKKEELDYDIKGMNFIFTNAILHDNNHEIGFCGLTISGDIEDGTQEGVFEGEYTVDTCDSNLSKVSYHNNEDGKEYTEKEFIQEFCGNDYYKMVNSNSTRDNIILDPVFVF